MKRKILYIVLAILISGFFAYRMRIIINKPNLPVAQKASEIIVSKAPVLPPTNLQPTSYLLQATSINLDVPFSPQAPFADWSMPYQEACEEASALLVDKFYKGESLTPEIADKEILKIVDWETSNFGYYEHTTSAEIAELMRKYFGYKKVEVKYDITLDDIKHELSEGRPLIVPFAGRLLGNPYFHSPGPVYHMLVVKGYTKDGKFITNDVGTKRGKDFLYKPEVLFNAIHDVPKGGSTWKNEAPEKYILTGKKAMVVVYP